MLDIYKIKHLLFQTVFKLNRHSLVKINHHLSHHLSQPIHLGTRTKTTKGTDRELIINILFLKIGKIMNSNADFVT